MPDKPTASVALDATEALALPAATAELVRPAALYLASCQAASRPAMAASLRAICRVMGLERANEMPWGALRRKEALHIRARLAERYAATSANRHLVALRGVLQEARRSGCMSGEELALALEWKGIAGEQNRPPAGRMLEPNEVEALLAAAGAALPAARGARDAAILALGADCGLRRAEIAALDLDRIDRNTPAGAPPILRVLGKRQKWRAVALTTRAGVALQEWIRHRGFAPGPLFWNADRGGRPRAGARLSPSGVWRVLEDVADRAGLEVAPHDLRRTFASTALESGAPLEDVAKAMGHDDPATTMRYDRRRGERAACNVAATLDRAQR